MGPRERVHPLGSGKPSSGLALPITRNPKYIPPHADHCPIEELLPPEVLAYIFELGTVAEQATEDWDVEEDDGDEEFEDIDNSDDDSDSDYDEILMPGCLRLGKVIVTDGPDDAADITAEKTRHLPFQVRMSHVCKRWRHIAIDTSSLWTLLDFSEPSPFDKSREWLSRSKLCPLDLAIDITLPDEDSPIIAGLEDEDARERTKEAATKTALRDIALILDLTIPHVSRWHSLELSVSAYAHMHSALKRLGRCPRDPGAPLLHTLCLFCNDDSEDMEFEHFVFEDLREYFLPFGGHAPRLTQVVLWGVHLDWNMFIPSSERSATSLNAVPSVTTNLTDLELAYHAQDVRPSYDEFVNIIRCATKLSSLKLSCSGPAPRQQGQVVEPLFLPNLRTLNLGFFDENYAVSLLRLFYSPGLTSICLDFDDGVYTEFVLQLAAPMRMPDPDPPRFKAPIYLPPESSVSSEGCTIDPSKPASILANVTEVKLNGIHCADASSNVFYSACPRLKRLQLNMNFLPLNFFTILMQQTEVSRTTIDGRAVEAVPINMSSTGRGASGGNPPCMRLEALTVSGMPGESLVTFVKIRRALGVPLRELNLDETDVISDSDVNWLRKNVEVVKFVEFSDDEGESIEGDEDEGDEDEGEDVDEEDADEDDGGEDYYEDSDTGEDFFVGGNNLGPYQH